MPTYVYECEGCGEFEQQQSIMEPALTRCPRCGKDVRRLIVGGSGFIMKGLGGSASHCDRERLRAAGGRRAATGRRAASEEGMHAIAV
jgi:putative FmdB family regulatory protein